MNNLVKGAILFAGGAVIGAATALLLAPKSGEEVRKEISDLAEDVKKQAEGYCEQLREEFAKHSKAARAKAEA
jgi:gas vesicle protein